VRSGEQAFYREKAGYHVPFFMDDQGFAAVRVNATTVVIDIYTSNRLQPQATQVLKVRSPAESPAGGVGARGAAVPGAASETAGADAPPADETPAQGSGDAAAAAVAPPAAAAAPTSIAGLPGIHTGRGGRRLVEG